MNKRFLTALLTGAFFIASTGMFVSCKDYDDDIKKNTEAISKLQSELSALQTSLQSQLDAAKAEFKTALEAKANQADLVALASRVAALETQVATIESTYAKKSDLEALATTVGTLTGRVDELERLLGEETAARQLIEANVALQQQAIETLEGIVIAQGLTLEDHTAAIEQLKSDLADFKTKTNAEIGQLKADIQALSERINTLNDKINVLTVFVQKRITSLVLKPDFYWEGIEGIEVPALNAMIFNTKKDYSFTYTVNDPTLGAQNVKVKVAEVMGVTATSGSIYVTEYEVAHPGTWPTVAEGNYPDNHSIMEDDAAALLPTGASLKIKPIFGNVYAKYHVNPNTASLDNANISFFENDADVFTRGNDGAIKATPVNTKFDGKINTFTNGILTVPFTVDYDAMFGMFAGWVLSQAFPQNGEFGNFTPEWDLDVLSSAEVLAFGDKLPFIAAQVEKGDTTVTSDYAVVVPARYDIVALADNNPELIIAGLDTKFSGNPDLHVVRANHLYESVGYNGADDQDSYGAIPMPATHSVVYNETIDLKPFIETHYDYTSYVRYGTSTMDQVMDDELFNKLGLSYNFTVVDYTVGDNVTGESKHIEQIENGVFAPRSVTAEGATITGKTATREAIGREPLIRVELKHGDDIIRYGYIKLRIIDATEKPDNINVEVNFGDIYMNCGEEVRVTWSQMENLILAKLNAGAGMTKQEFEQKYYMENVGGFLNMPFENPSAAGITDPSGKLYTDAANNKWMAVRYAADDVTKPLAERTYSLAQSTNDDDAMTKLANYTTKSNWFGRVWYTPHDNSTTGHNWDEGTNVIVWDLGSGKDADATNMTRAAYVKMMQVVEATYKSKGLNGKELRTAIRFINKLTGGSIFVELVFPVNKIHFAYADINRRVLDHWYSKNEGYKDGVADTIEVYANVPTPAEVGRVPLTTESFAKFLPEYWLEKKIIPVIHDASHFSKFTAAGNIDIAFEFRLPKAGDDLDNGDNTKDLSATGNTWKVKGISGNTYTLELRNNNSEIWAQRNAAAGMSAAEMICSLDRVTGEIKYMGRDQRPVDQKSEGVVADYTMETTANKVNGAASDILNLIGMFDNKGNNIKTDYLTGQNEKTFAAYVEIKVSSVNCYDPLIGKNFFNVRFLRPINAWGNDKEITDALNDTQFIKIADLVNIKDWRTYDIILGGAFSDADKTVPYEFYNITNLYVKRHEIRSDAYLEPAKRVALTEEADVLKLYSIDQIPSLTNGAIQYLKIISAADATASYSVDGTIGKIASQAATDYIAYTNNGGVVKPFHIYVPIAIEYPWGALRGKLPEYTQTVWAVILVNPTVEND